MIGKKFIVVTKCKRNSGIVTFSMQKGIAYNLEHIQQCCENADIIEVVGNLDDLVNTPIRSIETVIEGNNQTNQYMSYEFETDKGKVFFKWAIPYSDCPSNIKVDFRLLE